jgi:signal transduction histidine kinase
MASSAESTANDVANAMLRVTELNAAYAQADADRIARTRSRITHVSLALNALCVALALVAAATVRRAAARHDRLLRAHRASAEARADELERFADRVAHDIRSPLTTLGLSLAAVERRARDDDALGQALQRAQRGLARVVLIVDGLLEFARSGARPGPAEHADARAVLDDVLEDVASDAAAARVELRVEAFPHVSVACAPGALTSVVVNLVRNAVKYIGDSPERVVCLRARTDSTDAVIEVEDTGPGVPEPIREAIFQPHVRAPGAHQPGIGLGLATVRRICEAHGGHAGQRPRSPTGSVFWVRLPLAGTERDDLAHAGGI